MKHSSTQADPRFENIIGDVCLGVAVAGVNAFVVCMIAALVLI